MDKENTSTTKDDVTELIDKLKDEYYSSTGIPSGLFGGGSVVKIAQREAYKRQAGYYPENAPCRKFCDSCANLSITKANFKSQAYCYCKKKDIAIIKEFDGKPLLPSDFDIKKLDMSERQYTHLRSFDPNVDKFADTQSNDVVDLISKYKDYLNKAISAFESIRSCKYAPCKECLYYQGDDKPCPDYAVWEWKYADAVKKLLCEKPKGNM